MGTYLKKVFSKCQRYQAYTLLFEAFHNFETFNYIIENNGNSNYAR